MALRLQVLLPALLATAFMADAITRAVPLRVWTFRAWEAMVATPTVYSPFKPLERYDSARAFGDLANMGGAVRLRVYRRETFTTDEFGYRNAPGLADSGQVSVLLFGDSFAAGSGVADKWTLANQLSTIWGRSTYSLAPFHPTPGSIAPFAQMLKMTPGSWVVHEQTMLYNESHALPIAPVRQQPATMVERYRSTFRSGIWPMRILANQAWRFLLYGVLMPGRLTEQVHMKRLQNGDAMLFLAGEGVTASVTPYLSEEIDKTVAYAVAVANASTARGLRYVAVLVPNKTAAYRHLLEPPESDGPQIPPMTAELERRLRAAGLDVVNTFADLMTAASDGLPTREYVFWRDDTHWNEAGIAIGARLIARAMDSAER